MKKTIPAFPLSDCALRGCKVFPLQPLSHCGKGHPGATNTNTNTNTNTHVYAFTYMHGLSQAHTLMPQQPEWQPHHWMATTSVSTKHSKDMQLSKLFCASTGSGLQPWSMLTTVCSSCCIFVEPSSSPPDRAYVSIRQHTSAYVHLRWVFVLTTCVCVCVCVSCHAYTVMQLPSPCSILTRLTRLLHVS